MKMIRSKVCVAVAFMTLCTLFFSFSQSINASAATLSKSSNPNYVFLTTQGAHHTVVNVRSSLSQVYLKSGKNAIYKKKTGCLLYKVSGYSVKMSPTYPRYVKGTSTPVKNFSWSSQSIIFPAGYRIGCSVQNNTSTTYSKSNSYKLFMNYVLSCSGANIPAKAGSISLPLKVN